jgi:rhodanese-related sulfurtransferase
MKIFIFLSGLLMSTTACSQTKIDKAKFLTLMKTPAAKILDVRTPSEFNEGHINGAININYFSEQFLSLCEKQIPKKATVLVYCAAGGRSEQACRVLKKAGYTVLYDLKGGYDAW